MKFFITVMCLVMTQLSFADIDWKNYSEEAVKTAQNQGKSIVLGFHKKGCGTCHAQDKALEDAGIKKSKNVAYLKVQRKNEAHTKVYEQFGLSSRQWAAIVLLNNKKEIARIEPGVTSGNQISQLVKKLK